jgi:catechol 2,3-dioxygenase-like lactoylglutathione lyase family enzyme
VTGPALDRLDHLVLTVRDVKATCDFYADVLGMRVTTFGEGRIALEYGYQKINVHPTGGSARLVAAQPTPGSGDLCFLTHTPLTEWIARLKSRGVAIIDGPSRRAGAQGPIDSVYFRDPDGNLVEISNVAERGDAIAPLRAWLGDFQAAVRARDYARGRALCAHDIVVFGTIVEFARGIDEVVANQWQLAWPDFHEFTLRADAAVGALDGRQGWIAVPWHTLAARGRATITLRCADRWLATHLHFSPSPAATPPSPA